MNEKIQIGILGGGGILGAHAPGFRKMADHCKVVAVAEPVPEKEGRIRELLGDDVTIYSHYEDLLARADVDAVDIILPHDLHMPATVAAAEAGKQILVEKVMARNVWECDRMIEVCEKAGVSLTVCHDRRYHAEWQGLKEVVDSGVLGEIAYWKLDHNQDVNPTAAGVLWIADRDALGGGAIMSCLTHQIDALRWYGGEVTSVACMTKALPERMQGETLGAILARMESGALAHLSINWMTRSGRDSIFHAGTSSSANALWYEMVQVCGTSGEAYYMAGKGTFVMSHEGADVANVVPCEEPVAEGSFAKGEATSSHRLRRGSTLALRGRGINPALGQRGTHPLWKPQAGGSAPYNPRSGVDSSPPKGRGFLDILGKNRELDRTRAVYRRVGEARLRRADEHHHQRARGARHGGGGRGRLPRRRNRSYGPTADRTEALERNPGRR